MYHILVMSFQLKYVSKYSNIQTFNGMARCRTSSRLFDRKLQILNSNMENHTNHQQFRDKTLYHEALSIFYRDNAYIFRRENDWSFGDMTPCAVQTITRAAIHVEFVIHFSDSNTQRIDKMTEKK